MPLKEYLKYAVILTLLIIVQKTLIWLFAVTDYSITPDIVLIGVVYVGMTRGKTTGTVAGFLSGLLLDLFSFSFIGLMALSKTTAGFLSGFFSNENKTEQYLSGYVFITACFFCSTLNNFIYYYIYFQGSGLVLQDILLRYVLPTSVYTSIAGIIPVIFLRRKRVLR